MKYFFIIVTLFLLSCTVSKNPLRKEAKLLRKGLIKDDTSYVYALPYPQDKSHLMIQGYFTQFTHKERAAIDFKMKRGSKITAARGGVVIRLKEDGDKGGLRKKYRAFGNYIIIQHADSSRAGYWHLQKDGALVNVGDTIQKGQLIAISGKTGYTAIPHLHFLVWGFDKKGNWQQIATRFQTSTGIKYLRAFRKYKNSTPH